MSLKFAIDRELPLLKQDNFIESMLQHNDIENPEHFMEPKKFYDYFKTDPLDLVNMHEAVDIFLDTVIDNKKIGILVDDDADGFSSASVMLKIIKYFDLEDSKIQLFFHDKKGHGLKGEVEDILNSDCDLIIVPDAGSNDFKEQEEILLGNKKIIILDHHEVDNQNVIDDFMLKYAGKYALVNNQLDTNIGKVNKNLVGAGIVYKFAQAIDNLYNHNISHRLLDIVAMGQIGDSSDISDSEIHYIIERGLTNMTSYLLREVFSEHIANGTKIAPINLSFLIIPFINAIARIGTKEEKEKVVLALSDHWDPNEKVTIQKKRKNKITGKFNKVNEDWTHYAIIMDEMSKVKTRQNKEVDKIFKKLVAEARVNKICITTIDEEEIEYRSITGLIANKLVQKFKMPSLVLVTKKDSYAGSARGYEKTFKSFRQWCLDCEQFELAQGHDNAFGVEIKNEKLSNLEDYLENKFDSNSEIIYDVDKLYENESNIEEVTLINDNQHVFGGKLENPKFGYKDLIVSRNSVNQRGSVVTFFHAGLEFIMYKQDPGVVDDFLSTIGFDPKVKVDLVGSPSRNTWSGRVKEQIVLDDFSIRRLDDEDIESPEDEFIVNGELSF